MDHDTPVSVDQIPGITFHVESSSRSNIRGRVQLTAEIKEAEMWEEVVRRLEGFKVYSVDDFRQQLLIVLRQDNELLTAQLASEREARREENERAFYNQTLMSTEHESLRARCAELQVEVARLKAQLTGGSRAQEELALLLQSKS